nr:phage integrase N-terminal SAM-like domain-containing protein [Neolewinella aurantiaca]
MAHLRVAGMTSSTIINYARSLRDLMEYHHAEADAITARDILAFLAEREKSIGKSTLNTLCYALKYFYGKVLGDPDRIAVDFEDQLRNFSSRQANQFQPQTAR